MWPFSKSAVVQVASRDELILACNDLIERGKYIAALVTAEEYKRYALNTIAPSPAEEAVSVAYAYHMIAKARFFLLTSGKSRRRYQNYVPFFFANSMCLACLQVGKGVIPGASDPHGKINQERSYFYSELYRSFRDDPNVERADVEANQRVGEMMDASPFFWG